MEILGVNIQCCSLLKRKLEKSEYVVVAVGKFKSKRKNASINASIYVAITFCPFVSLEQRALALALFHISQLNNGMRYQTVLEQVTLQSSKGIFRE